MNASNLETEAGETLQPRAYAREGNLTNAGKGRKPGVPNRLTRRTRDAIAQVLTLSAPEISRWLQQVGDADPRAGLQYAVALARLVSPIPSRVQEEATVNPPTSRARAREELSEFMSATPAPLVVDRADDFEQRNDREREARLAIQARRPPREPQPQRPPELMRPRSSYSQPGSIYNPMFSK